MKSKENSKNINNTLEKYIYHGDNNPTTCDICLNGADHPEDKLVKCIICQEKAHQSCYGSNLQNEVIDESSEY